MLSTGCCFQSVARNVGKKISLCVFVCSVHVCVYVCVAFVPAHTSVFCHYNMQPLPCFFSKCTYLCKDVFLVTFHGLRWVTTSLFHREQLSSPTRLWAPEALTVIDLGSAGLVHKFILKSFDLTRLSLNVTLNNLWEELKCLIAFSELYTFRLHSGYKFYNSVKTGLSCRALCK